MGRYITREYLDGSNYLKSSPVFLDKMRLLFDTESLNVLLQLNIENISDKDISQITFLATTYDKNHKLLEEDLKLEVSEKIFSKESFSLDKPIILPNNETYAIDLIIYTVQYSDDTIWTNKSKFKGTELKIPEIIDENDFFARAHDFLGNQGIQINNYPIYTDDYWICSCSQLNDATKDSCKNCGFKLNEIKEYFTEDNIEKIIKEYQKEKQKQTEIKRKKAVHFIKICLIIIIIVAIIMVGYLFIKNELIYQSALKQYEKQNYSEVITKLKDSKGNKAKKLLNDTYYDYAILLMTKNDFEKAIVYLNKLNTNEAKDKIQECNYSIGLTYFNEKQYKNAIIYFEKVNNEEGKNKVIESKYQLAIETYEAKDYKEAIALFENMIDYNDSKEWINKCKLAYVNNNLDINNDLTRSYIDDLQAINYSNINTIYENLVKWTVDIYANNSRYSSTKSSSLSRYGSIYYHVELKGGKYQEEIPLKYRILFSNGSWSAWEKFDNNFSNGSTGYVYWNYGDFNASSGKTTLIIYNGNTNQEIGRHSVYIN